MRLNLSLDAGRDLLAIRWALMAQRKSVSPGAVYGLPLPSGRIERSGNHRDAAVLGKVASLTLGRWQFDTHIDHRPRSGLGSRT